jgi:NitT/TauT family transport system substrate-binding protein
MIRILSLALALAAGISAAPAQEHVVRLGMTRALASVATMIAVEKGYFKEFGIKLEIEDLDSPANALALLGQNKFQVVEGGIVAGYFNAIEKNFPITISTDRVSSPLNHKLLLRADLKDEIKHLAQLRGRIIASNAPGSTTNYEVSKIFATAGLTLKDAQFKVIPFSQVPVAFANKAIDAALMISPWVSQLVDQGLAVELADADAVLKPSPATIAVSFVNTDWAAKQPELARNFFLAYLRAVRDYCQAYHGGANRDEVIAIAMRTGVERRPELIHKSPWPARNPAGRINIESLLDLQTFYMQAGLTTRRFPAERLVTSLYVDYAAQKLAPFVLENKDSKLAGCR